MKLRTGRKNRKNLYVQWGDQPSDTDDFSIGYVENPNVLKLMIEAANQHPERLEAILVEGVE